MAKAIMRITGKVHREPRKINGVIELYFNIPMSYSISKRLRVEKNSYRVVITEKMWNKFIKKNEVNEKTYYYIEGETISSINASGNAYITVICSKINAKQSDETDNYKVEWKKIDNNWRKKINESELVEINISEVDIEYEKHKHSFIEIGDEIGKKSIIAVNRKENGRYTLIAGYKAFVSSIVYRRNEKIKAYIYDKDRKEFIKEFGIDF